MTTETTPQVQIDVQPSGTNRRQRWGWYLFDFANSILIINGSLYFPQWLVIDNKVSGSIYTMPLAAAVTETAVENPDWNTVAGCLLNGRSWIKTVMLAQSYLNHGSSELAKLNHPSISQMLEEIKNNSQHFIKTIETNNAGVESVAADRIRKILSIPEVRNLSH